MSFHLELCCIAFQKGLQGSHGQHQVVGWCENLQKPPIVGTKKNGFLQIFPSFHGGPVWHHQLWASTGWATSRGQGLATALAINVNSFCLENVGQLTWRIINYHSLVVLLFVPCMLHTWYSCELTSQMLFGTLVFCSIPIYIWKITPGDSYIICRDGLKTLKPRTGESLWIKANRQNLKAPSSSVADSSGTAILASTPV